MPFSLHPREEKHRERGADSRPSEQSWQGRPGSNRHGSHRRNAGLESAALAVYATPPSLVKPSEKGRCARRDSNLHSSDFKSDASTPWATRARGRASPNGHSRSGASLKRMLEEGFEPTASLSAHSDLSAARLPFSPLQLETAIPTEGFEPTLSGF